MSTKTIIYILLACSLAGCASSKKIAYFQDLDDAKLLNSVTFNAAKIKADDMLSIIVSGPDKEVIQPYNFSIAEGSNLGDPERSIMGYIVNTKGEINFPNLGTIKVEGMTRAELEDYLTKEIGKDVKDPVVSVSFKNFKITVLGEVREPGTYMVNSEKVSILQALGLAGDLLISGKRENVLLIREVDNRMVHINIDLRSKKVLESPYFYLQQNDVLYVQPSVSRVAQGRTATGVWTTIISSVTTLATIIALILK